MKHTLIFSILTFATLLSCKKDKEPSPVENPITVTKPITNDSTEIVDSRDGQKYKICKIGDQWWMAENLNYKTPSGSWYYNNDSLKYSKPCGRLYLWTTAMKNNASSRLNPSGVQGISPNGWHIPSQDEWIQLQNYLSSQNMTGDDLKGKGTAYWPAPNSGTNSTLFNAVPAGTIFDDGRISANIDYQTNFLTSTIDNNTGGVWGFGLAIDKSYITTAPLGLENAWSIRCVKDNFKLNGTWKLIKFHNIKLGTFETQPTDPNDPRPIIIRLTDNGKVGKMGGETSSNSIYADYELSGVNKMTTLSVGDTRVADSKWSYKFEEAFSSASSYVRQADKLFIYYNSDNEKMEFDKQD